MKLQIGVKLLVQNHEGEYLFIKRTKLLQNESKVSWDIPGGRIESNEYLEAALKREVYEEIGYTLESPLLLINAQDIFVEAKDLHVVRLTYTTNVDVATVHLSDEHQDAVWLSLQNAKNSVTEPFLRKTLDLL